MIKLIKSYPYDNNYDYTRMFATKVLQNEYFSTFQKLVVDDDSYVKDHETFLVPYNYDELVNEGVNYVCFNNGYKDVFAFIIRKEYVNDGATRIIYETDVIQTYMFDFSIGKSFIERKVCTIGEITDYDEGLYMGEHEVVSNDIAITKTGTWFAMFNGFKEETLVFDENEKLIDSVKLPFGSSSPNTVIDGITYPIFFMPLVGTNMDKALADNPSLVGIIRFPNCTYTTQEVKIPLIIKDTEGKPMGITYVVQMASVISSAGVSGASYAIPKGEITDFYPYTYYVLSDGETSPLVMQPQYLPSSVSIKGMFSLSNQPVERYCPSSYKNDTSGAIYNITNTNQMMLPTATNEGINYMNSNSNTMAQDRKSQYASMLINGVGNGVSAIVGATTGNVSATIGGVASMLGGIANGYNEIKKIDSRNNDIMATPNSISSFGTPSTRIAFGTNNVRFIKYTIKENVKQKIRNFVSRYGNKFNSYGTVDIKSYKGYIKYIAPNIDSKIDNQFVNKIAQIVERGVYIE